MFYSRTLGKSLMPISSGKYSIGCADLADQKVFMRLYYPHQRHNSAQEKETYLKSQFRRWTSWFAEPEYATAYLNFKYSRSLPQWMGRIFRYLACDPLCPVLENAAITGDGERFPVILFSHGNGGCRTTYSMLCADMASKGFLVAALEHSDGSACIARRIGQEGRLEWVQPRKVGPDDDYETRHEQVSIRSEECRAAVSLLEALNEGRHRAVEKPFDRIGEFSLQSLAGRIDLSGGVVLSGHSFGAGTVVKALQSYKAFRAGFCFDAWMFPIKGEAAELSAKTDKPLVFLNYELFQWKTNLETMRKFEREIGDKFGDVFESNVITLKKAIHYTTTDLPTIINGSYMKYPLALLSFVSRRGDEGVEKRLLPEEALTLSVDLFTSWLRYLHVSPLLDDTEKSFDQCLRDHRSYLIWGTKYKD